MVAFNKFNVAVENIPEGVHDLGADTLKVALSNTAPVATNTILANITQITGSNGYTTGGATSAQTGSVQTAGTYKLTLTDVVWTASGGDLGGGALRYAVLYNDTPTSPVDPLIGWWDRGSSVTIADGDTLTWDQDIGGNGVIQIS